MGVADPSAGCAWWECSLAPLVGAIPVAILAARQSLEDEMGWMSCPLVPGMLGDLPANPSPWRKCMSRGSLNICGVEPSGVADGSNGNFVDVNGVGDGRGNIGVGATSGSVLVLVVAHVIVVVVDFPPKRLAARRS